MKYSSITKAHLTNQWAISFSTWSPEVTNFGCFSGMFNHLLLPLFLTYLPLLIEHNKSIWCCKKLLVTKFQVNCDIFFSHFSLYSRIHDSNQWFSQQSVLKNFLLVCTKGNETTTCGQKQQHFPRLLRNSCRSIPAHREWGDLKTTNKCFPGS